MKLIKMLGSLVVVAAGLMAFAGSASALITSPPGTAYTGTVHATSTNVTIHTGVTISCGHSTIEGTVTNGGTTIPVSSLTFTKCEPDTWVVLSKGHLSIASNGTVTSTGAEITKLIHRSVLGFPVTTHCLLKTNLTPIGTLTEGTKPSLHIGSSSIPRVATDGACGETSIMTGTYEFTAPHSLEVD